MKVFLEDQAEKGGLSLHIDMSKLAGNGFHPYGTPLILTFSLQGRRDFYLPLP